MPRFSLSRNAATAERMRRRMAFVGHTPNGHPLWNRPETGHLVDGYPGYDAILPLIPRRTRTAAHGKASRLKITKPKAPAWSDNEILRLRKIYPTGTREEILAAFPGRSYAAVAKAANARGIYRAPRPYKPTGNRVLDQILERARGRNWTLVELGEETKHRRYFANRGWKNRRFDLRAHALAAQLLGGELRADFPQVEARGPR